MAPAAAMEPCVRSALLAHEGQHERMLEEAVHAFIQQHRQELAQELVELKGKRASDQGAAAKAFETGLEISMARMLNEFKQEQVDRIRQ
jgi:DNA-binding transcriptional MerR regulator